MKLFSRRGWAFCLVCCVVCWANPFTRQFWMSQGLDIGVSALLAGVIQAAFLVPVMWAFGDWRKPKN